MPRIHANLLLLAAAALWGFGNIAQKTVLQHLDVFGAVGLRCLIGALLLAPFLKTAARRRPGYWASLFRVAAPFALGMVVQQAAYLGTSVTNASFLINIATVLTPLIAWALLGERPTPTVSVAAGLTVLGAMLLAGGLDGAIEAGDAAAILAACFLAVWMVELSRHMREHGDAVATASAQFALTALATLPVALAGGHLSVGAIAAAGPELIVLGVFSTAVAFGLQTVAQRHVSGSHAAIVVSAEAVFGAAGAAVLIGERLSPTGAFGCALVLMGIVAVAMPLGARVRRAAAAVA